MDFNFFIEEFDDSEVEELLESCSSLRDGTFAVSHEQIVSMLNSVIQEHVGQNVIMTVGYSELPYITEDLIRSYSVKKNYLVMGTVETILSDFVRSEASLYGSYYGEFSREFVQGDKDYWALKICMRENLNGEYVMELLGDVDYRIGESANTLTIACSFYYAPESMVFPSSMRPSEFSVIGLTPVAITKEQLAVVLLAIPSNRILRR